MTALLGAADVHYSYPRADAVRGVDLQVAAGERLAVTGPSGSGKSTLLHLLAGVLQPRRGEVRIEGEAFSSLDDTRRTVLRRRRVGLVLQFGQLVPELTALENVMLPLLLEGTARREAVARARDGLDRLGVGAVADVAPHELSGGQAQRVAVARALVTRPRVVLADEPTGSLDSVAGREVLRALLDATADHGAALVVVTHDNVVAAHCDREVVVRDGRLENSDGRP